MHYRYQWNGKIHEIFLERQGEAYAVHVNGENYGLELIDNQPGQIDLRFEGKPVTLYWAAEGGKKWISYQGCTYLLEKPSPQSILREGETATENILRSPMPAQVRAVLVSEGQQVQKGETLLLLEAMKMEIRVQAPREARIARISAVQGQQVQRDAVLVELV
ncbi:MAG: biotin/lipoyl-binding protein [Chloroflexi bacterium]|nr:MAG: biotin/lipoyl-binding protein [Chloroflexota bacterium]